MREPMIIGVVIGAVTQAVSESQPLRMTRKTLKGILPSRLDPAQVGLLGAACLAWDLGDIQ